MSKAAELKARARGASERAARHVEGTGHPPPPAVRVKPVRITLDLDPQAHRALKSYCAQIADGHGLADVPIAAVLRALLAELSESPALQESISNAVVTARRNTVSQ